MTRISHHRRQNMRGNRRASGGRASAPVPEYDINALGSKLTNWVRGDAGVTLATSEVSAWADQQTQNTARNYTAGAGVRPLTSTINGRTAIDFPGVDEVLSTTGTVAQILSADSYEVFVVFVADAISTNMPTYSANDGLIGTADAGHFYCALRNDTGTLTAGLGHFSGGDKVAVASGLVLGTTTLLHGYFDGALITCQLNDGVAGTVAAGNIGTTTGTMRLGQCRSDVSTLFDGKIAEVVICNATLSGAERTSVRGVLKSRWGGAWTA